MKRKLTEILLIMLVLGLVFIFILKINKEKSLIYEEKCDLYNNIFLDFKLNNVSIFLNNLDRTLRNESLLIYFLSMNGECDKTDLLFQDAIDVFDSFDCIDLPYELDLYYLVKSHCNDSVIFQLLKKKPFCKINNLSLRELDIRIVIYSELNKNLTSLCNELNKKIKIINSTELIKYKKSLELCRIKKKIKEYTAFNAKNYVLFLKYGNNYKNKKKIIKILLNYNFLKEDWLYNLKYLFYNINLYEMLNSINNKKCEEIKKC